MYALEVKNLSMYYKIKEGWIKADDNISLNVDQGYSLGIVGESGCGKTSLVSSIFRILPINGKIIKGEIYYNNLDLLKLPLEEFRLKYRWKEIAMIFQNSMNALNPVLKIRKQMIETIKLHDKVTDQEATNRMYEAFKLVNLRNSIENNYPHELSGGMKQRVIIALSLLCKPKILIADEPTTALDVVVQDQILNEIKKIQKELGFTLIMISHNISVVFETCEKIAVMYGGTLAEYADSISIFKDPRHPYTAGLLRAFPSIHGDLKQLISIPGNPPNLINPSKGCRFEPRCKFAKQKCKEEDPPFIEIMPNEHYSLCHFADRGRFEW